MTTPGGRPRIYAAHPITSYGTDHERAYLDALAALLPGAEIFNPAGRYRTSAGWLRAWPRVARTLSALVVFGNEEGTIGVGCLHEIADAIRLRPPVVDLGNGLLPGALCGAGGCEIHRILSWLR